MKKYYVLKNESEGCYLSRKDSYFWSKDIDLAERFDSFDELEDYVINEVPYDRHTFSIIAIYY